jgi:RNA 3'-terminal phosphate cyclase (ATP)
VLRTSLALTILCARPVRLTAIRARRSRPGLKAQHLAAVRGAASICGAEVRGDALGSSELWFAPGPVVPGLHDIDIGTAGSATLVLQTVLLPLLMAPAPSRVVIRGGTHNPLAPTYEFLAHSYLPALELMGARASIELGRHGFYPAGGGLLISEIQPGQQLEQISLCERGREVGRLARALVAHLPRHIAEREIEVVRKRLGWRSRELQVVEVEDSDGPGNALILEVDCGGPRAVFSRFGQVRVPAERVAAAAVRELLAWRESGAPVEEHLADQLLLPMALAGGGRFVTSTFTSHARTGAAIISRFLPVEFRQVSSPAGGVEIVVAAGDGALTGS